MSFTGRALTSALKRNVMERILKAWEKSPELRLGQLIESSMDSNRVSLFYEEDLTLTEKIEAFAEKDGKPR